MPRRRQSAGAIRLPSEFYGGNSGRYTANAKAGLCGNAYGNTIARSHGTIFADGSQTGPNMHAHPDAIGVQTGGRRRRRRSSNNKRSSNKDRSNKNRNKVNKNRSNKNRSNKNRSRTNKNRTQSRRNRTQRSKRSSKRNNKRN